MKKFRIIMLFLLIYLFFPGEVLLAKEPVDSNSQISRLNLYATKGFAARKYVLGPNDIINIAVFNVPELAQDDVRIQPDGKIMLPYIGAINVSGLSLDELHDFLYDRFKEYLKDPEISVKLTQSRPFIVYVTGAVMNPGGFELNTITNTTPFFTKPEAFIERKTPLLTNILVAAGGITFDADLEHVQVKNEIDGSQYEVNLLNLLNGDSKEDIYLVSGDSIHVPKMPTPLAVNDEKYRKFASATFSPQNISVKVVGYVNNPGLIRLDTAQSLNLNSAIVSAGGYLRDSAYMPKKVYISRADNNGKLLTRAVNPMDKDLILMPNDIVYVPEKLRPLAGKSFDYMARAIAPFFMFSNTYNIWDNLLGND